jgi:hypothetical protein
MSSSFHSRPTIATGIALASASSMVRSPWYPRRLRKWMTAACGDQYRIGHKYMRLERLLELYRGSCPAKLAQQWKYCLSGFAFASSTSSRLYSSLHCPDRWHPATNMVTVLL